MPYLQDVCRDIVNVSLRECIQDRILAPVRFEITGKEETDILESYPQNY